MDIGLLYQSLKSSTAQDFHDFCLFRESPFIIYKTNCIAEKKYVVYFSTCFMPRSARPGLCKECLFLRLKPLPVERLNVNQKAQRQTTDKPERTHCGPLRCPFRLWQMWKSYPISINVSVKSIWRSSSLSQGDATPSEKSSTRKSNSNRKTNTFVSGNIFSLFSQPLLDLHIWKWSEIIRQECPDISTVLVYPCPMSCVDVFSNGVLLSVCGE